MITPSIRQNLQLLQGTPMEDGSPSWLLYDNLRNKYFTLGVNAFRMLKHWIAGVDTKQFIEQAQQKGCLLYTSPSPRDVEESRMPSSA